MTPPVAPTPAERADALAAAIDAGGPYLDAGALAAGRQVIDKVRGRLRHGTANTVVALAGPTGAGKSSLFNALCGEPVSETGVRRPTTGTAHACVWGGGASALLAWLGVTRRHDVGGAGEPDLAGMVLVDLPDFDSTEADHRLEVSRLVELVDLLVWVTDPQKYADESLHFGYLVPLAGHGHVMRFVLNKADTLYPTEVPKVVDDFAQRLIDDGIERPTVIATSVADGSGVDIVADMLREEVSGRRAAVARIEADLRAAASELSADGEARGVDGTERERLVAALGHAAGVDTAAELTAAQHRRDAADVMGWPPGRWVRRRRRHPVADLPRAGATAASTAEVAGALRNAGEAAGEGLAAPWPAALRRVARAQQDDVERALTAVTSAAARGERTRPRWWSAVAWLQRVLVTAAAAGLVWLLVAAVLGGFLQLDTDPLLVDTPGAEWIPLPSLLLLGGVVLGLVVGGLARLPARAAARRRARRVRSTLHRHVAEVADQQVIAPIDTALETRTEIERLLDIAAAP